MNQLLKEYLGTRSYRHSSIDHRFVANEQVICYCIARPIIIHDQSDFSFSELTRILLEKLKIGCTPTHSSKSRSITKDVMFVVLWITLVVLLLLLFRKKDISLPVMTYLQNVDWQ